MNSKFLFNLQSLPILASSLLPVLLIANSAAAKELSPSPQSCDLKPTQLQSSRPHNLNRGILVASAQDDAWLDFSAAESDAAVNLFGCDCPSCIQALGQLRSKPTATAGQGHCWTNLTKQNSPQQIQQVLQSLDQVDPQ
ncbi:MAG: hypothetical protein VKL42_14680 [Snowella sp.]|nr:hypothetical protein [Snowella sp.]